MTRGHVARVVMMLAVTLAWTTGALARTVESEAAPESKRLARAKDFIADEQWPRAIEELRVAVADAKESRRDEALYWLAHSLNQAGDQASAIDTIARLESEFPSSMWVKPARSLYVDIAVRLNRSDVLWKMAMPPPPPPPPTKTGSPGPIKTGPPASPKFAKPKPDIPPPPPPKVVYTDMFPPDPDLQVQALGALMKTDSERVLPILKQIAYESEKPGPAMRAVFMLAQSPLPEARATVVKIAETGPEPVRVAAVRDLGRFGGPDTPKELLSLYPTAIEPVKYQIVKVLGERADTLALMRIVEVEKEDTLRFSAITGLGQAGGSAQLAGMYKSASLKGKRPIIIGLFRARADTELIRIAETEQDAALRQEALERLRLLGTPKAKEYLQKVSEKR